uniref:manganese efflux pump MntP n=1 Tax=Halomonas sp. TaxID=1486246 RepID=UPI00262C2435|nr:manganese efflux pump MntP [Halomonas sp.]
MSALSTTLLAFSMSTDAFAASLSKGACLNAPRFTCALKTGLLFGVVEACAPVIGWLLGLGASQVIQDWDHWVIFTLLLLLGGRMIYAGLRPASDDDRVPISNGSTKWWLIIATAITTSLDAMAVGIGLAFMSVNIWIAALAIGAATTLMATIGIMVGHRMGSALGQRAEIIGGLILAGIGCITLYQHLTEPALF